MIFDSKEKLKRNYVCIVNERISRFNKTSE